jgi:hypothetical protein
MVKTAERQITKVEFKRLYVKYGQSKPDTGWTQEYWNRFYENETGMKYVVTEPESPNAVMWIGGNDWNTHRMFFLSEDATESYFDFPDKE